MKEFSILNQMNRRPGTEMFARPAFPCSPSCTHLSIEAPVHPIESELHFRHPAYAPSPLAPDGPSCIAANPHLSHVDGSFESEGEGLTCASERGQGR